LTIAAAALLCLSGCGSDLPEDAAGLGSAAAKARDDARAAREAKDSKAAARAADLAERCAARLGEIAGREDGEAEEARKLVPETDAAAREARRWAELADEERRLAKKLKGLKARGYRGGRGLLVKGLFKGLAAAADQAAEKGLDGLPPEARDLAAGAAVLAAELTGREPLADGSPDWKGISADMSAFAEAPPPRIALYVAGALFLAGRSGPALYEISAIDESALATGEEKLIFRVARALIYRANGFSRLAVFEVEQMAGAEGKYDPELQAGLHLVSAYFFVRDKEYAKADLEISRAMRADPDNPVAVFLTGERLAASGEWEKAAESLESASRGMEHDWLAKRIAQRAREVRDSRGTTEPLVLDKRFAVGLALEFLGRVAAKSEAGRRITSWLKSTDSASTALPQVEPAD
jgi:hypothetical protein